MRLDATRHPADHGVPRSPFESLEQGSRCVHLVGICGSGMKALADLLTGMGCRVTGSDINATELNLHAFRKRGLRIHSGHDAGFLPADTDLVVFSAAVDRANPELREATRLRIPQLSYAQMLGRLMQGRTGICIAGTHGKSTTTAMTATILRGAGLSPSAVFGAELCGTGAGGWAGSGELFVVESCEYQRSFLQLRPKMAAILGVEPDHFDCYANLEETTAAFAEFAAQLPDDGILLVPGDCATTASLAASTRAKVATFSDRAGADWWVADVRKGDSGTRCRVFFRGNYFSELWLPLPGRFNRLNALAATALSHYAGASPRDIAEGLREFKGIRRRFEEVGSWRGLTLVDDYAHHPTAVAATLRAARERYGRRRIWCVFQPHQVSRARALLTEFAESFQLADQTLIVPVFAAREQQNDQKTNVARELADRIAARKTTCRFCPSLDRVTATLEDESRPGDVLITMGAGDINRVHNEFTRRLQRRHSA